MAKNKAQIKRGLTSKKKTVYVGMSGGVDSSVSAAILQRDFNVVGVFIKVWTPDFLPCTWREDRRDAMRVCAHLGIPFHTLDLEKEYKRDVVDYMIKEYKAGRTPNPDVMCNKAIKFGAFYDYAMKNGADFVSTGHYARSTVGIGAALEGVGKDEAMHLYESRDKAKDQSYFIWNLKPDQLRHVIFPIGNYIKDDVRKIAKKMELPTALKKDSQGLCFLGKVDMKEFLKHFIKEKKGDVLDINGKKIGTHDGAMFLTIGQRHGFVVKNKKDSSVPLYITSKDIKKNTITVAPHLRSRGTLDSKADKKTCVLSDTNWLQEPIESKTYGIRFRYHQELLAGKLSGPTAKFRKNWKITLNKPFAGISPGQSAVVYDKEELVGGGIIV